MSQFLFPFAGESLLIQADQPSMHFFVCSIRTVDVSGTTVVHGVPLHTIFPWLQKQDWQLSALISSAS